MNSENVGNVLGALAEWVTGQVESAVSSAGLNLAEVSALSFLSKYPGRSIEGLRAPLGLSHSGCVRLVDRLAQEGYVERRMGEDARTVALCLTRRGRGFAEAATERRAEALARALHVLDPGEQELLGRLVSKLLEQSVPRASMTVKVCRLCDYAACVECPFEELDASGR
ncbi:MarR family winged helix-turn-helix transcriptional regulator [Stigmatella hybrida]|uniref:MarR family winged helix-turn-helix transcriptional regulator n=1 Tax=Stigmatella hybrida TaxID=394097 RepID=UPI001CDAC85E|nr:MarR family winged helix-turn-helix transcriptional regulator [Stigmatella hybrida]